MNEIEARKARAVALLSGWLRDNNEATALDLLEQVAEATEHVLHCSGFMRVHDLSCPVTDEEEIASCDCDLTPCLDCKDYREGRPSGSAHWPDQRPVMQIIDELTMRLERREESVA